MSTLSFKCTHKFRFQTLNFRMTARSIWNTAEAQTLPYQDLLLRQPCASLPGSPAPRPWDIHTWKQDKTWIEHGDDRTWCAESEKRTWYNKYKANKWRELFGAKQEVINRMHKSKRPARGDVHEGQYWCTAGTARQYPANTGVSIGTPLVRLGSIPPIQGSVLVHRWFGSAISYQHRGATVYENRIFTEKIIRNKQSELKR